MSCNPARIHLAQLSDNTVGQEVCQSIHSLHKSNHQARAKIHSNIFSVLRSEHVCVHTILNQEWLEKVQH